MLKLLLVTLLLFSSNFSYATPKIKSEIMQLAPTEEIGWLLLAIADIESSFNPAAIGPTNDYGLFQFTPIGLEAAKSECAQYKHIQVKDLLNNVHLSTKLAICLLNKLNKVHANNLIQVLIAYNAGTNRANIWAKNKKKLPTTTKNYVLKVMHTFYMYKNLNYTSR